MMEKFHKEFLGSGIRVVTEEVPGVRSATVGIWVNVGSCCEKEGVGGVSHFVEHMIFKGTPERTAREISETIDRIGGDLGAFTGKEQTCYYVKVAGEHIETAITLLADILKNSLFVDEEFERERGVILEEIRMYEDTPDELIHDFFISTALPQHSLGRPVIGNNKSILELKRASLLNYYKDHYTPDKAIISVAGNFNYLKVMKLITENFSTLSGAPWAINNGQPEIKRSIVNKEKDTEQVHICLGTKGVSATADERFVLSLLDTILGGGMSSRLFYEIREKRGLAYHIASYSSFFRPCGLFTVYCGTSPQNLSQIISLVTKEFKKIKNELVDEKELSKVKEQLKGGLLLALENTAHRMSRLAKQEAYFERFFSTDEIIRMIDTVTANEIMGLANRLFLSETLCCATIGPISSEDIAKIELSC
ncbi:MAG: pitrilysin family protein [bacterium]|nr:pitrilysin family protein [bacterium]